MSFEAAHAANAQRARQKLMGKSTDILHYIQAFADENGYSPTVREIGEAVGISSTAVTYECLNYLRDRGQVTWEAKRSRTVRTTSHNSKKEHTTS